MEALNDKTLNHSVNLQAVTDMLRMAGYKDAADMIRDYYLKKHKISMKNFSDFMYFS